MHRVHRTLGGRGIVLLAMLLLAVIVGVGTKSIDAITDSADDTSRTPTSSSIDAPPLATTASDAAMQIAPTVAPVLETPTSTKEPVESEASATKTVESIPDATKPSSGTGTSVTARAVYAYDLSNKTQLYELNSIDRMPVGSIVKVATALVTVEHVGLDESVVIDESDLVDPGVYSNMGLMAGDTLTVEQLLQGLLIPSGGDAALALARYVGEGLSGSDDPDTARAAFVDAMNEYAVSLGLENTHFSNPDGDNADDNYSSAADVAWLGAALMQNDDLAAIVAMPDFSFESEGGNLYEKPTTNELLGVDGIIGIKTGSTGEAGGCVVLAQETASGGIIILTVLGSDLAYDDLNRIVTDARWDDARQVLQDIDTGAS
ncbi:MAG: serine hydrolase [Thermomicrobiales bacterium]